MARKKKPASTGKKLGKKKANTTSFKSGAEWRGNAKGRPPGSRNKLSEAFLSKLAADFDANGAYVIERVRTTEPAQYLRVVASIVPKEFELGQSTQDAFREFLTSARRAAPSNPYKDTSDD
jgi:hypothetical protein